MMERTDRHYRYMARLLTRRTLLYTEMVTTWALLHGDRERLLDYSPCERPLALQLGGDRPDDLAQCAAWAEELGYDEVNLNVGCPSERVVSGRFGACLMAVPERVAELVAAMRARVRIPVTVKHRIGINGRESYDDLANFVRVVAAAGCARFTVHARIAILGGLSPAENREIPPLRYDDVYRLKADFPALEIELNGGVRSVDAALLHLRHVDSVMIGRAAYENPRLLAALDDAVFHDMAEHSSRAAPSANASERPWAGPSEFQSAPSAEPVFGPVCTPRALIERMISYAETWVLGGGRLAPVLKPMLTIFDGKPGARRYRRNLSELVGERSRTASVEAAMRAAVGHLSSEVVDEALTG